MCFLLKTGQEIMFRVARDTNMIRVMTPFARQIGTDLKALRFVADGVRTIQMIHLKA